ncbi:Msa family membrane protein, partial [Streptomyces scabiei]
MGLNMIYFLEVLFYVILGVIEFFTINQLSSISFIILFYVLPILCTLVVSSVKSGKLLTKNLLSSILALVEYLVMGNLFNNLGLWSKFVARNSMKINNGEIQISNNMLS